MGSFGIGTNTNKIDSGYIREDTYPVACMAWYAPGYPPRPLLAKFKDHEGIIQTINLNIETTDIKYYNSFPVYEYRCMSIINKTQYGFKLLFYILECKWVMII
ncbi:hypothetical protein RZO55_00875 [Clostridium boliviensis]|uniref:Uncharacterized protein n=1 Tax=Clostridium boliviensis TaxID=318465 RepID=A0ABU4GGQ9_9CLOT|nr:hypothetical protein [Clostridium boliviensis]MDW2796140.1 hypothetical protein [Clostridium boliviensis]